MQDSGSTGCSIKPSSVGPSQNIGQKVCCRPLDGSSVTVSEALLQLKSAYFTGWMRDAIMQDPCFNFLVGDIPGVCDKMTVNIAVQHGTAVVARSQMQHQARARPLEGH